MKRPAWIVGMGLLGLSITGCDRVWTIGGQVVEAPLGVSPQPAPTDCKVVRQAHSDFEKLLSQIEDKTDELLDLSEADDFDSADGAHALELSHEIQALRIQASKTYDSSFERIDRFLNYSWSVDLQHLIDPFPHPKFDLRKLQVQEVHFLSVVARVGIWSTDVPFQISYHPEDSQVIATASRKASAIEACLDGERVFLDVKAEVTTNFYGKQLLFLRLKGAR